MQKDTSMMCLIDMLHGERIIWIRNSLADFVMEVVDRHRERYGGLIKENSIICPPKLYNSTGFVQDLECHPHNLFCKRRFKILNLGDMHPSHL